MHAIQSNDRKVLLHCMYCLPFIFIIVKVTHFLVVQPAEMTHALTLQSIKRQWSILELILHAIVQVRDALIFEQLCSVEW